MPLALDVGKRHGWTLLTGSIDSVSASALQPPGSCFLQSRQELQLSSVRGHSYLNQQISSHSDPCRTLSMPTNGPSFQILRQPPAFWGLGILATRLELQISTCRMAIWNRSAKRATMASPMVPFPIFRHDSSVFLTREVAYSRSLKRYSPIYSDTNAKEKSGRFVLCQT